jgi:hypothetical protein
MDGGCRGASPAKTFCRRGPRDIVGCKMTVEEEVGSTRGIASWPNAAGAIQFVSRDSSEGRGGGGESLGSCVYNELQCMSCHPGIHLVRVQWRENDTDLAKTDSPAGAPQTEPEESSTCWLTLPALLLPAYLHCLSLISVLTHLLTRWFLLDVDTNIP